MGPGLLLKAVSAGRCRHVRTMLDAGQDIEQKDDCKQTPLIRAIFLEHNRQREKMIKLLLKYEARASNTDAAGRNALSWACLYGHSRDVDMILENADVDLNLNQVDMNGESALFHAATSGSAATVKLMVSALRKYALNLDVANFDGVTPLMEATCMGHDICAAIIQNGGATVGVNSLLTMEDDLETAEKWAVKSKKRNQRSSSRGKSNRTGTIKNNQGLIDQSKTPPIFPPIIPQAVLQKIKYRENRAVQLRVHTPVDSEDDSNYGSEVSYYTEKSFESINSPIMDRSLFGEDDARWRYRSDCLSIMSVSQTSSTENNLSSDDEASPKIQMKTIREPEDQVFQVTQNLPAFFRIYEELNSPSYRPPINKRQQCFSPLGSTSSDSACGYSSPSPNCRRTGSSRKKNQHKVLELRKMLLRKQAKQDYIDRSQKTPTFPVQMSDISSGSDTDSDTNIFSRKSVLPRITKGSPLVSDMRENPDTNGIMKNPQRTINYSEN